MVLKLTSHEFESQKEQLDTKMSISQNVHQPSASRSGVLKSTFVPSTNALRF